MSPIKELKRMSASDRYVQVKTPIVMDSTRLVVPLDVSPGLRDLIGDHIYFTYDEPIATVPPQILAIPAVANLAPLAWVLDLELKAPHLDRTFFDCLPNVRRGLANMFPKLEFRGHVSVDQLESTLAVNTPNRSLALFSGGVDSLDTALRHCDESLTIAAVWGIDVRTNSAKSWEATRNKTLDFANRQGIQATFISTNVREYLYERRISRLLEDRAEHWWLVAIGMSLLGMTAPLTWLRNTSRVYLASGVTDLSKSPIGYHPTIDNHVRWAATRCVNDGSTCERLEKLRTVTRHSPDEQLLVCRMGSDTYGRNCSRCEKCIRTMVGLLLVGADPNRHGFRFGPSTLESFHRAVLRNAYTFNLNNTYFWQQIQRRLQRGSHELTDDIKKSLTWIEDFDFEAARRRSQIEMPFRKKLRKVAGPLVPSVARKPARRLYFSVFRDL
jgi:hypothetical protein